ncbi:OstA-like protein [Chitinophaga sp. Hz27]|uniref:OstA-like protein n=1 Tax=Chitinophaga sp. Hz27 TaxID=3347169 RepID=UPI0035E30AF1
MRVIIKYGLLLAMCCIAGIFTANAQQAAAPPATDTTGPKGTRVDIKNADVLYDITTDTLAIRKLIGNVKLVQGNTIFYSDSAIQNLRSNHIDAYGKIHINQADSINIYGDVLNYDASTRIATLTGNARMTDGKVTITGPELIYDMNAKIGSYLKTGKLVNGKSTLTSDEGFYYVDMKEMHFQRNVVLIDPEYTLTTDALLYNTETKIANIIAPTTINEGKRIMYATSGYYDTDKGYANFTNRPLIEDSTGTLTADQLEMDKVNGKAYATGNMVYRDTIRHMSLLANYGIVDQVYKTLLATQKPLLIMESEKDTFYMASDTLFTGIIKPGDSLTIPSVQGLKKVPAPLRLTPVKSREVSTYIDNVPEYLKRDELLAKQRKDSITGAKMMMMADTALAKTKARENVNAVTNMKIAPMKPVAPQDSLPGIKHFADSINITKPKNKADDTTEIRYILAYHHVRMFSDSLQGVADSVYYSSSDSIFRFFRDPIIWTSRSTEMYGDTVYAYTKNQTVDKLVMRQHAFIINETGKDLFNQIKGNTITGYVVNKQLDWMFVEGNAETIMYAADNAGAFMNVSHTLSATISLYFKDNEIYKAKFITQPETTVYPFTQRPIEELKLEHFKWEINRRPKSKFELMQ